MKQIYRILSMIALVFLGAGQTWAGTPESNSRVTFVYEENHGTAFASAADGSGKVTITVMPEGDYRCLDGDLTAETIISSVKALARSRTSSPSINYGETIDVTCTKTNEFTLQLPDDEDEEVRVTVRFREKAPLTVTAIDVDIDFGEEANNGGVRYSDFEGDDDESVLEGTLSYAFGTTDGGVFSEYQAGDPVGDYQIIPSGLTSADYKITFVPGTLTVKLTNIVTQDNFSNFFDESGNLQDNTSDELIFQGEFSELVSRITLDRSITITGDNAVLKNIAFNIAADGVTLQNMTLDANSNLDNLIDIAGNNAGIKNMNITYDGGDEEAVAINVAGTNDDPITDVNIKNNTISFESHVPDDEVFAVGLKLTGCKDALVDGNRITTALPCVYCINYDEDYYMMGSDKVNAVRLKDCKGLVFKNNTIHSTINDYTADFPTIQAIQVIGCEDSKLDHNNISLIDEMTPAGMDNYLYGINFGNNKKVTFSNNNFKMSTTGGKDEHGTAYAIQNVESEVNFIGNSITSISNGPNLGIYVASINKYDGYSGHIIIEDNFIQVTGFASSTGNWALVSGIEIQNGDAKINNNTIYTYNVNDYAEGNYMYGISYAQWMYGDRSFDIQNNTVYTEGKYAISVIDATDLNVEKNTLFAHELKGDDSVNPGSCANVNIEDNLSEGDLSWSIADGTLSITGKGAMTAAATNAYPWYNDCSVITTINIGEGVTSIADNAFGSVSNINTYSNVTKVFIPSTVTSIGADAFKGCVSAMDVYCYADPTNLRWGDTGDDFKSGDEKTKCHVADADAWSSFSSVNVTFVGDLAEKSIPYIDADGNMAYCTDFTVLTGSTADVTLGSNGVTTWYVVNSDVNYGRINLYGDVNLILCDGKTVTCDGGSASAIVGSSNLTIYGQTAGTGELKAYCGEGNGIHSNAITINGGTVNATGGNYFGISASGNVTINGGNVRARATGNSGGIKAGGNIILGWTNSTDRIYASNFSAGGTISISDGKAFTDGTNVYTSATSSDDLEALTNVTLQPVTGVTLTDDGSGLTASLDPSSEEEVNIPVPVEVDHVNVDRIYVKDKASTVYLPFSIAADKVSGGKFYSFTGVDETKTTWEVTYDEVTGTIEANTPYIFLPDDTNGGKIVVNNGSDKVSVSTANPQTMTKGQWEFIGTYKPIKWLSNPSADGYTEERDAEIGSVYGFAAEDLSVGTTSYAVGQFVKVGSGAHINPMRAYLKRTPTHGVRGANGNATQPLPQTMKVVIRSANGETTTVGTLTLEYETGDWFSIDGHKLSSKPSKKGMYIHEGKKVLVP